jgi:hypothetical protein
MGITMGISFESPRSLFLVGQRFCYVWPPVPVDVFWPPPPVSVDVFWPPPPVPSPAEAPARTIGPTTITPDPSAVPVMDMIMPDTPDLSILISMVI